MSFLKKTISKSAVPRGRFTYRGLDEFKGMALQLRIEPDNRGILVINANTVLHLNETASAYAYFFMQGLPEEVILKKINGMYRVNRAKAKKDFEKLVYTISTMAKTEKVCPISFLEIEKEEPFSYQYSSPLRADLALTFKCQNNCVHCYTGGPQETDELSTNDWKLIIDRLTEIGVFILTFTGGEPTLRDDLPELLLYAQHKGMVTGLITNGRKLKDQEYLGTLEKTGLDFVQVTLESRNPKVHDLMTNANGSWNETVQGIRNAVQSQIYVSTNTTLSEHNAIDFLDTITFIKNLKVNAFGCNSLIYSGRAKQIDPKFELSPQFLNELLPKIQEKADELKLKFLWYTPTQYCQLDPVELGLGIKSCTAATINICVGPNGVVYPCQSCFEALGNILTDKWEKIWNSPLALKMRKHEYVGTKCDGCPKMPVCGGGCPLKLQSK